MGAEPRTALAILCWPAEGLPPEALGAVLAGGAETMAEAGCAWIGGHTVRDEEPKFGFAVTGVAHPDRLMTNAAARAGDVLLLTKPLGTGIATTALKRGAVAIDALAEVVASMRALNATAARAALDHGVRAATDVTGFGLLGHASQMAEASGVTFVLSAGSLPIFEGVLAWAADHVPGGGADNRAFYGERVRVAPGVDEARLVVAHDPQTSGGLLLAVAADRAEALLAALRAAGWARAERIGAVVAREPAAVRLET